MVRQSLLRLLAEQVHRVVEEVRGADVIGDRVVVAEDDGHVDEAFPQLLQGDVRMEVHEG